MLVKRNIMLLHNKATQKGGKTPRKLVQRVKQASYRAKSLHYGVFQVGRMLQLPDTLILLLIYSLSWCRYQRNLF